MAILKPRGQLFVGTCYQPIDRSPEEIHRHIDLMKQDGFTLVRMGDLSWDSLEPAENQFDFAWFDRILDEMYAANIKVIPDIGGLPAPMAAPQISVGERCQPGRRRAPSCRALHGQHCRPHLPRARHPLRRRAYETLSPQSSGSSYWVRQRDRQRFHIIPLATGTASSPGSKQNIPLSTTSIKRGQRNAGLAINSFDEVELPYEGPGPGERYLDLHRFWSDITVSVLEDLKKIRERNTPNFPAVANLWDTNPRRGFDYLSSYKNM
jgi:beta-galactosidase